MMAATAGQNNSSFQQNPAFADAVQRAKQIAAKIQPGGQKRSLDDAEGMDHLGAPDAKRLAGNDGPPFMGGMGGGPPGMGMGRGGGGMGGGPPGSGGPEQDDITVPDKMVGLIIGRGGEQITRLQRDSGAKIQMASESNGRPERACSISGNREAIDRAKDMIFEIVNKGEAADRRPGGGPDRRPGGMGGGGGGGPPGIDMSNGGAMVEISIPGPKVGLIIGKNGETIKNLQEKSGAKMVIIQDSPAQENEKPLRITGEQHKVDMAKQLVYDLIAEKETQAAQFGGRGRGRGGFRGGDRRGNGDDYGDGEGRFGGRGGGRGGFNGWGRGGPMGGRGGFGGPPGMGPMGRGGPMGPGGPGQGEMGRDGKMEVHFNVPATKCGLVIGKGGETIKQINADTSAHCELDRRPPANPMEKTFIIRGSPEQIDAAKRAICEKAGMDPSQMGPGGGPGGPGPGGPGPNNYGGGGGGGGGAPQGWGNTYQQWNQGAPDMGKQGADANAAAWTAYYNSYGGSGQNPMQPPNQPPSQAMPPPQQPQVPQQAAAPAAGGQADYSAQWVEYYRSMGMTREAEAIEAQAKTMKQAAAPAAQPQQPQPTGAQGTQDYSQQWIDYYRSQNMHAEAEKIEAQLKAQKGSGGGAVPAGGGAPAPGGSGGGSNGSAGGQDFSQQWVQYYRSQGNHAEADKIEASLKKGGGGQPMYGAGQYNPGY